MASSSQSHSTPKWRHRQIWLSPTAPEIRLYYIECIPAASDKKGTILLIHGFPETSYQFRHVITPLVNAGYHVVAPDIRGAGYSSHPYDGYTKKVLAQDLHSLMTEHVGVTDKIHIVGYHTGGMIAHAYVAQFADAVASITWGECPLPGTIVYEDSKHTPTMFHFHFLSVPDLPETLFAGKEKILLKHFYDRVSQNPGAFTNEDLEFYATQYSAAGGLRCGFNIYRALEIDAKDNRDWLRRDGKVKVRSMILSGEKSFIVGVAEAMAMEMYENVKHEIVESGHWIAEENPEDFVKKVLGFIEG